MIHPFLNRVLRTISEPPWLARALFHLWKTVGYKEELVSSDKRLIEESRLVPMMSFYDDAVLQQGCTTGPPLNNISTKVGR